MAINRPVNYIIAYDISDPRRLGRVHRFLKREAASVQYSVYAARVSERQIKRLLDGLQDLIDTKQDDVRAYRLPERCEVTMLGNQALPEGIVIAGEGLAELLGGLRGADQADNL